MRKTSIFDERHHAPKKVLDCPFEPFVSRCSLSFAGSFLQDTIAFVDNWSISSAPTITENVNYKVPSPVVQMTIRNSQGNPLTTATVGDKIYLQFDLAASGGTCERFPFRSCILYSSVVRSNCSHATFSTAQFQTFTTSSSRTLWRLMGLAKPKLKWSTPTGRTTFCMFTVLCMAIQCM